MRRSVEDTLSFLCGAGIGAAMMYVMDPDLGQPRRRYLAERASDAYERASESLGETWEATRDSAGRFAKYAGAATAAGGAYLGEQASDLSKRARKASSRAGHRASAYGHSLRDRSGGLWDRVRGREQESHVPETSAIVTAAAAMVAGMAIMYLLDPQAGRRRRKLIGDKAYSYARQSGDYMSKTSRHLRNKAVGLAHDSGLVGSEKARERRGDQSIVERVREKLGSLMGREKAQDIDVSCDEGGCVTLTAIFIPDEARVLDACRGVEGVSGVNVTRPTDTTSPTPRTTGSTTF